MGRAKMTESAATELTRMNTAEMAAAGFGAAQRQ